MSDPIDRQSAIDAIDVLKRNYPSSCFEDLCKAVDIAIKVLSAQLEIIRCKDCKYYTSVTARCEVRGKGLYLIRGMEDFCSRAERRADGMDS